MSSERQVGRGLAGALLALLMTVAGNVAAEAPTWRGLDQLTDDERAQLDFATNTPRDAKIDYLPAEAWPFKAPYTAEEMGYRAAEFVHISRWPHSLVDVFGVITSSGYISQGAGVTYIHQNVKPGFESYMHDLPAGQVYSRWLIYSTFPPQTEAEQQLWVPYRTDVKNPTKMEFYVYAPSLRKVRRQPQPRRDQRFPDNAQTFDDVVGRDPWEFSWELVGADVIAHTVRFPNTRPTLFINVPGRGYVETQTADIKPMGDTYPFYRADGGVDCWVVKATVRDEVLPGYNEHTLIFWLDKHYFYPLRMEKYDAKGQLMMVEVRNAKQENPARGEFGYAAFMSNYWFLEQDLLSYSVHDGHQPREWTAEQAGMMFTPEFMRRQWLVEPVRSQTLIDDPEQYYLRPELYEGRFPELRKFTLDPALRARVDAQEAAGRLVFESARASTP